MRFSAFAAMHVRASGGPIHAPHEHVLQLLIEPWAGDHEAWTVYRHEKDPRKEGKIVFKKWNYAADRERFRALGRRNAPRKWVEKTSVSERHFPVSGRWVSALEGAVGALSVPPIAGSVRPLRRDTTYQLSLWRSTQESEFTWNPTPPTAWGPLARLFSALLRSFREHTDGKPLAPVREL
jgi:hypothetical protein